MNHAITVFRQGTIVHEERVVVDFPSVMDDDEIESRILRSDFEGWIAEELEQMASCVDGLLRETHTRCEEIEHVFLTGGSAFVPAVRKLFEDRFGPNRLEGGDELVSVARGLALRAQSLAAERES